MRRAKAKSIGLMLAAAFLGLSLAGCGDTLLGPQAPGSAMTSGETELPVLAVAPNGGVSFDSVSTGTELWAEYPATVASVDGSPALTVSARVDGAIGGTLRGGRFILIVPPGAFAGIATISMTLPDSTVMLCDMGISPGYLNLFKVPVSLTLDTHDLSVDPATLSIYWYDPVSDRWVDMHSEPDLLAGSVTESLSHFSRYAGGKAGW